MDREPTPAGTDAPPAPRPPRDPRKAAFETNKLRKRLRRLVGQAIADYGMIGEGDRVMVLSPSLGHFAAFASSIALA